MRSKLMLLNPNSAKNDRKQIVRDIIHIRFPSLRFLQLTENQIESVEAFSIFYIPSLEELDLCT